MLDFRQLRRWLWLLLLVHRLNRGDRSDFSVDLIIEIKPLLLLPFLAWEDALLFSDWFDFKFLGKQQTTHQKATLRCSGTTKLWSDI